MSKTVDVTLGDQKFSVPRLNVDQIEQVQDIVGTLKPHKTGKAMLVVALSRAEPPVSAEALGQVECSPDEILAAVDAILRHSGFKVGDPNAAAPVTTGA